MIPKRRFGLLNVLLALLFAGGFSFAQAQTEAPQPEMSKADSLKTSGKHLSFGSRYLKSKQYEDAEIQLKKAWEYNPTRGTTARYLGKLFGEQENYEEAIQWYKKAVEVDPKSKYTKGAYQALIDIYILQENQTEAIQALEALLEFGAEPGKEIQILHKLVSLYVEEEDYENALNYADRWGELEPNNPDVQDMIAKLNLSTGGEDEAIVKMEEVLKMDPENFGTLDQLAEMYRRRGETRKAFSAYEKLHSHDPKNYLYLDNLLVASRQLNKSSRYQLQLLKKMHGLQPNNLGVVEQLADVTGSLRMINRGLKLDSKNGKLLYLKGDYYYKKWKDASTKGDSTKAMAWFNKALVDPQWRDNAKRMIDEINPPLTKEELIRQEFFEKAKKKKEEVRQEGKR